MTVESSAADFKEKRRYFRINASNSVYYALFDEGKNKIDHGKGRTLDLSQKGTLLETQKPLQGAFVILMTIDVDNNKLKVKGRVVNTRKSGQNDSYLTGIEFIGSKDEQLNAIVAFVKAYNRNKYKK